MKYDLKPCPFCGHRAYLGKTKDGLWHYVYCANEDCAISPETKKFNRKEYAIYCWNRRLVMKDKEKQICKHFDEEVCSKLDCKKDCKYYGKANCKTCIHEDICQLRTFSYCEEEVKEKGCEHYQPKLPEGARVFIPNGQMVLLSREERQTRDYECQNLGFETGKIEARKEFEKTCKNCHWISDYKILKHHEEEVIKLCEQEVKQASKETAENILITAIQLSNMCRDFYEFQNRLVDLIEVNYGVKVERKTIIPAAKGDKEVRE